MKLATWLHGLPNKLMPAPLRLMQLGAAFWQSRALCAATRLDLATFIGDETLSTDEIARRAGTCPEPTARLLRMLSALGVFEQAAHGRFKNNGASDCLRHDRRNLRAMILMHNSEQMSRPWYEQLERGLATGVAPFELAHGVGLYSHMDVDSDFDALFSKAMDTVETLSGDSFAVDFDWSRFDRVIDIGGSRGQKAASILKRRADITALVVDRARVVDAARRYWRDKEDAHFASRLQFISGDVFDAVPRARSAKDVYLLSGVLHGFDDESSIHALRNVATAAGSTGARIVLYELVLDETRPSLAEVLSDMQMFMGTRGRERTLREWMCVFDRAAVALQEVVNLRTFGKLLVLQPQ